MVSLNQKYCISYFFFLTQLLIPRIHAVVSKLLDLSEILLWGILFYIVCAGVSDIDRRRYGWDNLFRKSSLVKEYGGENLVVSSDKNKLGIDIFQNRERAKK